jgi:hypothetical protein
MAGIELDGANQKVVLDADGDTYLEAATDDTIKVYVAGAHDATISANAINVLSGTTLTIDSGATITNSGTANGFSSANPASADGDTLGTASLEWSDLFLADGGTIQFGNDQEITLTHSADSGLLLKHTATADDKPVNLVLQTGETDMAANDVIGKISFQAPDEGTGTDAILISGAIQAVAEGDHSSSSNATRLEFMTGASEAATAKMSISSGGIVGMGATLPGDLGAGLHIKTADSGASVNANCDELVIEGSGNSGLTILSGASSEGLIFFGDSGSNAIGRLEYNHSTNAMAMTTGGNTAMIIDGNGHVTMPLQSCFSVTHSVSQTNLTEEQQNTITFGNEIFDINGDFASNTFTAPVTGKYLLTAKLSMAQIDHDGTYYSNITINTSNRNYKNAYSVRDFFEAQPEFFVFTCTCIADMDASDTAVVEFGTYGPGASQEDVYGTSADATQFMGQLIS